MRSSKRAGSRVVVLERVVVALERSFDAADLAAERVALLLAGGTRGVVARGG
jgi:hypothetical protein